MAQSLRAIRPLKGFRSRLEQRRFNRYARNGCGSAQRRFVSRPVRCRSRSARPAERPHAAFSYQGCARRSGHRGSLSVRSRSRHHYIPGSVGHHNTCSTIPAPHSPDRPSLKRLKRRRHSRPPFSAITAAVGARRRKTAIRSISARIAMCCQWPARTASTPKPGARTVSSTKYVECRKRDLRKTSGTDSRKSQVESL